MTVTREQAQMLTHLAIASRPHRAPTWDEAGVMAAIGRVKDRALPEVILAVIRAAADRDVASPGVIPSAGSHWQEQLKAPKWEPEIVEPAERCSICSKPRSVCETAPRFADDDHTFQPDFRVPSGSAVDELRDIKAAAMAAPDTTEET